MPVTTCQQLKPLLGLANAYNQQFYSTTMTTPTSPPQHSMPASNILYSTLVLMAGLEWGFRSLGLDLTASLVDNVGVIPPVTEAWIVRHFLTTLLTNYRDMIYARRLDLYPTIYLPILHTDPTPIITYVYNELVGSGAPLPEKATATVDDLTEALRTLVVHTSVQYTFATLEAVELALLDMAELDICLWDA